MYRPKPKAVVIVEETFVLLKPDAVQHHGDIIDELRDNGFFVTSRQMPSTRAVIDDITYHFADVAALRREAERAEEQQNAASFKATSGPRFNRNASTVAAQGTPAASTNSRRSSLHMASSMASSLPGGAASNFGSGRFAGGTLTGLHDTNRLVASWQGVREEHSNHLIRGTCIAIAVSASNAVDRVSRLCGPDEPDVARASAPESLRARYGGATTVENAVFCAPNHHVAADLIFRVFGYEPQLRSEALQEGGADSAAAVATAAAATTTSGPDRGSGSDTHTQMLVQPGAFLSGAEFHPTTPDGDATLYELADIATPQQVKAARESLIDERATLKRESERLRQREVDLLLREEKFAAQMEEIRRNAAPTTAVLADAPVGGGGGDIIAPQTTAGVRSPAPPQRRQRNGPLRGAPVSSGDSASAGAAAPPGQASRRLDHRLNLRPKTRSRAALHAGHLREVIPEKRVAVMELQKQLRDLRRATEMAAAADHHGEADTLVAQLWTVIRARENEESRVARVAAPAGSPLSKGILTPPQNAFSRNSSRVASPKMDTLMLTPRDSAAVLRPPGGTSPTPSVMSAHSNASAPLADADPEALAAANAVLVDVFAGVLRHVTETDVTVWAVKAEELDAKISVAEEHLAKLERELKANEAKPQYADVDGVEALADLGIQDLEAIATSPGTITSLFLRFDGARDHGRISKADFVRFYETCAAFRDTGVLDDTRRIREMVAGKYSPGKTTMSLDEFSAMLLWLVRR